MARMIDKAFGWLLLVGALLHAYGSVTGYPAGSETQVWALSGTLAAALTAGLNLLRAGRRGDPALAWLAAAASLCWACVALGFGAAIGAVLDPRVLWHVVASLALLGFSLRSISRDKADHLLG